MTLTLLLLAPACLNDLTPQGGWSSPVLQDGYFYVGNKDGRVARIEAQSGSFDHNWRATNLQVVSAAPSTGFLGSCGGVPRGQAIYGTPLIEDGTLYAAGYACTGNDCEGGVFAVDLATGDPVWREQVVNISTKIVGKLAMGDGTLVFGTAEVGGEDDPPGYIYAIDPVADAAVGVDPVGVRVKWRFAADGNVYSAPAISGNVAYFGTTGGSLYAVDLADSQEYLNRPEDRLLWKFEAEGAITAPPLIEDGQIYFGDFSGSFYSLNIAARSGGGLSGTALDASSEWKTEVDDWVWAQALALDGILYVSTLGGGVYAFDQASGRPLWPEPGSVEGQVVAQPSPVEHVRGPAIAVPSGKSDVYIVSLASGEIFGQLFTNAPVKSKPLVEEGFIYVHTEGGQLKSFSAGDLTERSCVNTRGGEKCE